MHTLSCVSAKAFREELHTAAKGTLLNATMLSFQLAEHPHFEAPV